MNIHEDYKEIIDSLGHQGQSMNIYIVLDHDQFWPVGAASIVVAANEEQATDILDIALTERGLKPSKLKPYTLERFIVDKPRAEILLDGNY